MHPILFRVPLPGQPISFMTLLLAVAAIAGLVAAWQAAVKAKVPAIVAGALAIAAALAGYLLRTRTFGGGPIPIYSYGVMLGLSLVVGWYLSLGLAERDGLPKEAMANNYIVTAVSALVGARLLFVLTNLEKFDSLGDVFSMQAGGLVAYGGFLGGFLGSLAFLRLKRLPLLPWADVAVPSLAAGLMITRIGCYLFGCDFGEPLAEGAPGWLKRLGTFPKWPEGMLDVPGSPAYKQHLDEGLLSPSATASLPVHPTQLYEAVVGAGLLTLLLFVRRRQSFRGQIFLLFTVAYGACRFLLEVLRDDEQRGSLPPALPEHLLYPIALTVLSVGYAAFVAPSIRNLAIRRATQALAFLPPLVLFLVLRPGAFEAAEAARLSTSQAVGVATGLGAAIFYSILHKAAEAHPEAAMRIDLPPEYAAETPPEAEPRVAPARPKARRRKGEEVAEGRPRPRKKTASGGRPRPV